MKFIPLIAALALASCGADGAPTAPKAKAETTGFTVTGEAQVGITSN